MSQTRDSLKRTQEWGSETYPQTGQTQVAQEEGTNHRGVVKTEVGGELMSGMVAIVGEGMVQGAAIVVVLTIVAIVTGASP